VLVPTSDDLTRGICVDECPTLFTLDEAGEKCTHDGDSVLYQFKFDVLAYVFVEFQEKYKIYLGDHYRSDNIADDIALLEQEYHCQPEGGTHPTMIYRRGGYFDGSRYAELVKIEEDENAIPTNPETFFAAPTHYTEIWIKPGESLAPD
jgi:hypothetical protein